MIEACDPSSFPVNHEGKGETHAQHTFVRTSVIARLRGGPLGPYLDDLATALHHAGYAPSSTQRYLRAAEQCTQWLQEQGYAVSEIDGDLVQRYISGLTRYRSGSSRKRPRVSAISSDSSTNKAW